MGRIITTADELDSLPQRAIIRAVQSRNPKYGDVFERFLSGWLHLDPSDRSDGEGTVHSAEVLRWHGDESVTVLWEPSE